MKKIILASTSPRRRDLLAKLDIPFSVATPYPYQETYPTTMLAREVPGYLSQLKSKAYTLTLSEDELLLTADTLIIFNDQIIGKPKDKEQAKKILHSFSGHSHTVLTGVTLRSAKLSRTFSVSSDVFFRKLTDQQIEYYVEKYNPIDKAGAYGIQEWIGLVAIERIEGSFYNVVGLPTSRLMTEINKFK
ncbi:MAG: Maf family nucleotide pyrophosphatase [Mucinivorans sp.]